jgi:hypothetical protein
LFFHGLGHISSERLGPRLVFGQFLRIRGITNRMFGGPQIDGGVLPQVVQQPAYALSRLPGSRTRAAFLFGVPQGRFKMPAQFLRPLQKHDQFGLREPHELQGGNIPCDPSPDVEKVLQCFRACIGHINRPLALR